MLIPQTTVLCHLQGNYFPYKEVEKKFPKVNFVPVPTSGPIPSSISGQILITSAAASDNLLELTNRDIQWVHCVGHGVDHIPPKFFENQIVTCSRGVSAVPIAEWVLSMILAWTKKIPETWINDPPDKWFRAPLESLAASTVALIGLGSINLAVAERLIPFRCQLSAVRRTDKPPPFKEIKIVGSVTEAIADADHVVIATPLTSKTHHLIDTKTLNAAKSGVHLINIARGSLINQTALKQALDSGKIGRASLDVADPEPLPLNHWLYKHPKVRFSPHVSWTNPDHLNRMVNAFVENLNRWIANEPLNDIVDTNAGY